MKRTAVRLTLPAALVLTVLSLTAGGARASTPEAIAMQVGAMPIDSSAEVFYAQDQGFFKAAGLDVKLTILNNGAAVLAAAAAGTLDIGFGSPAPLIAARQRGIPVRFFAPAVVYQGRPNTVLVVSKDSPIRSAADLNGKTVAVAGLNDLGYYSTQAWIEKNGGNPATISFVEIPYAAMGAAIETGRISAGCSIEPFISGLKDTRVLANLNAAVASRYMLAGWFAMDSWMAHNPEALKRFSAALQRSARWANAHQHESAAILARYTGTSTEVAQTMSRAVYDTGSGVSPQVIQPVIDLLQKYGKMTSPPAAADLTTGTP
jgi:NitT/TauT family transport system substrate-binding protein